MNQANVNASWGDGSFNLGNSSEDNNLVSHLKFSFGDHSTLRSNCSLSSHCCHVICILLAPRSWREEQDNQIKIPEVSGDLKRNNSVENVRKFGQMLLSRISNIDEEKAPQGM